MQYVLLYDNYLRLGPFPWVKKRFQSELEDEYELNITLPDAEPQEAIVIDEHLSIQRVASIDSPNVNPKFVDLAGPFITVDEEGAHFTFSQVNRPVDHVKQVLISEVAENRWKLEVSGVTTTIQTQEVFLTTQRGERDMFLQALQLGSSDKLWKFGSVWLELTLTDLQDIVTAVVSHVQSSFDWEASKVAEINGAVTLEDLIGIETRHASQIPV